MTSQLQDRQPVPPDPRVVEALVNLIARTMSDYSAENDCTLSDVFSAMMTMTLRTIEHVLYHTDPPMSTQEVFTMRKTILKGLERMWTVASGGGPSSRFKAH